MNLEIFSDYSDLKMSKEELSVISSALVEFSQEMHWAIDAASNKGGFKRKFEDKFEFSLEELDFIEDAIVDLRVNLDSTDIKEIYISFGDRIHKKQHIIYAALNECSENFEDYEFSIRTPYFKEELDAVLKDYKEKVMDVLENNPSK